MQEKKPFSFLIGLGLILILVSTLTLFAATEDKASVQASSDNIAPHYSSQLGDLPSCADGVNAVRDLQPPAPITPEPSATPDPEAPTPTPPPPRPTPLPAPQEDNVGFPVDYPNNFKLLFLFDRPDNKQVRVICGNEIASTREPGEPFPYGSILVMETWRAKLDDTGAPVLDDSGNYIRSSLFAAFIQRKEAGFGEAYGSNRSGEWEYAAYWPDGRGFIPPSNTANCAICHAQQAGPEADYVFRMDLFHEGMDAVMASDHTDENEIVIDMYEFMPNTLTVKVGTTVTWTNYDEANHTVESVEGVFASPLLRSIWATNGEPDSFSFKFDEVGMYEYFCSIHPAMTGMIEVIE